MGRATAPVPSTSGRKADDLPPPNRLASVLSGSLSGALVSACVQPLDVVRTRMQEDAISAKFRSTPATFRAIVREAGVRRLWRGTSATITRLALGAGCHFLFLDLLRPTFETVRPDGTRTLTATGAALTGGISRAIATAVLCPISLVKTRMEATGAYSGAPAQDMLAVTRGIVRQHGVRGLWRGALPTILSNAPFSAIYYSIYREIKAAASAPDRPQAAVNLCAALIASMAATLATQPTDVVRARIQLGANRGTFESASAISKHGGRAFMSGAMPRFLKRSVQTALVWTLYEELFPLLSRVTSAGPTDDGKSGVKGGGNE